MELELNRTYYARGTNGKLYANGRLLCYCIELPWKDNLPGVSCIPEGRYELRRRYSPRFKKHLMVCGVEGRALILIHRANDALKELKGCIAPVSELSGEGRGSQSAKAFERLGSLVFAALERETVFLIIQKQKT